MKKIFLPEWASKIDTEKWIAGYGYINQNKLILPVENPTKLEIALTQAEDIWSSVAKSVNNNSVVNYFEFSILGFINLWMSEQTHNIEINLFSDVKKPILYRHPAIIPMEISFNEETAKFEKSIIYAITDFSGMS